MEYKLTKTIESPGFIIRVHSPVLTPEEKARRMKAIYKSAEMLLKNVSRKGEIR